MEDDYGVIADALRLVRSDFASATREKCVAFIREMDDYELVSQVELGMGQVTYYYIYYIYIIYYILYIIYYILYIIYYILLLLFFFCVLLIITDYYYYYRMTGEIAIHSSAMT